MSEVIDTNDLPSTDDPKEDGAMRICRECGRLFLPDESDDEELCPECANAPLEQGIDPDILKEAEDEENENDDPDYDEDDFVPPDDDEFVSDDDEYDEAEENE